MFYPISFFLQQPTIPMEATGLPQATAISRRAITMLTMPTSDDPGFWTVSGKYDILMSSLDFYSDKNVLGEVA
jgi:hypothetical protein